MLMHATRAMPPPKFSKRSLTARPMVAFARKPGPKHPWPPVTPIFLA